MNLQDRITIITVCDNHYAILLAALIKSIEVNHKTAELIDLYIIEDNIHSKTKQKLQDSVTSDSIRMRWLSMSEVMPSVAKLPLDDTSFPLNIYVRLFIPYFIPENLEKILYMDVDMIVLEDISKLWKTDLGTDIIAGVVDKSAVISNSWAGILNYKALGLAADTKYFNSGLLLFNPLKWRSGGYTKKIVQCIKDNLKYAIFPDQYGLNVVFANQWVELDPLWNSQSASEVKNPYLIHFTAKKPIYKSYDNSIEYKNEFYKYLNLTPWKGYKPIPEYKRLMKKLYNKLIKKIWYFTNN